MRILLFLQESIIMETKGIVLQMRKWRPREESDVTDDTQLSGGRTLD